MFGLGFGEILVILVVVLLVFGPDKLPDVARTLGRTLAELRRSVDDFKHELTMPSLDSEPTPPHPVRPATALQGTCEDPKGCDCGNAEKCPEPVAPTDVSSVPTDESSAGEKSGDS